MRRLIPHLAAAAVIGACIWLTLWQIDRAGQKRALLERAGQGQPVALADTRGDEPLPLRIRAVGNWRPERQILIDNRIRNGQPGVFVLTPLEIDDGRVFLVNRGWASWPARGAELPDPSPGAVRTELSGLLNTPPGVGARIGPGRAPSANVDQEPPGPVLMTWLDPDATRTALGHEVDTRVVQLDPQHPAHLTGDAWKLVAFGPDRHLGYALTWATMAATVALIWIILGVRQWRRQRR